MKIGFPMIIVKGGHILTTRAFVTNLLVKR